MFTMYLGWGARLLRAMVQLSLDRNADAFEEIRRRLINRGAADDFVTDFGPVLSMFFTDPDGLEGEVCVPNPDAKPGVFNPPGTRAARYPAA